MDTEESPTIHPRPIRRNFIAGVLMLIPIWITCLVIAFIFRLFSSAGGPFVKWLSEKMGTRFPNLESILTDPIFQAVGSFLIVVIFIYFLGMLTSMVIGRKLIEFFEAILARVPVVRSVYGSVKKLTTVLQEKPTDGVQRVVLIDFPSPEMKTVGLVTRILTDAETGNKLAAVYVPTTPNPTSGYLEIVPVEKLTQTQWTMDEAMNFIVSGGAVAPEEIFYDRRFEVPDTVEDGEA